MNTVTLSRTFDAQPERVFVAWTDPEEIARWYGPANAATPADRITVDLRPGGRWEVTMVRLDGDGEFPIGYEILEVREPNLLVMRSDPMPQMPEPTIVRIEITADGDGTRLTLTDGPLPEQGAAGAEAAYAAALHKLADALSPTGG